MQMGTIPAEMTSFVGRRNDLIQIRRMIESARLTTLTGVGGVGKTRLALQVARQLSRAFSDGVVLVELADLNDPALLPWAVCVALGLGDNAELSVSDLEAYLADRTTMVLLDNCEHLLPACAALVSCLLMSAPNLRFLATSRQGLGVGGEHIFNVSPLAVPGSAAAESVDGCDAVVLFVERARTVDPDFTLGADNRVAVAQICRRLDGIPLAIELAAAQVRGMPTAQIADRLDDRFRLRSADGTAVASRQMTLDALLDWSFDLLSPAQQQLWARLSVFAGGFELEAAETICCDSASESGEFLYLLIALVEKSLVIREEIGGRSRYRLLETVRQYAANRLALSEDRIRFRLRHCAFYLSVSERAGAQWFGPHQDELLAELRGDHWNLRAALEFCLTEEGDVATGLKIACSLWFFWTVTGFFGEALQWLGQLLERYAERDALRVNALYTAGWLSSTKGDLRTGEQLMSASRSMVSGLDDWVLAAAVAQVSGLVAMLRGDLEEATLLFESALAEHRRLGDAGGVVNDLIELGSLATLLGDHARALDHLKEAEACCVAHGERWLRSYALAVLAILNWRKGDLVVAAEQAREGIRIEQVLHDQVGIALCLAILAWISCSAGEPEDAAALLGSLQPIWTATNAAMFGNLQPYHDAARRTALAALGQDAFDAVYQRGVDQGWDRTLQLTLTTPEQGPAAPAGEADAVPLSRRERAVAELIADGLSDKEIAARLVIAQRTAEGHVQRLLRKLDFSRRAQVAAWVAERRASGEFG